LPALLLVVGSLAVVFAVGEGVLRFAHGRADPYVLARIVRFDERLGWTLAPGEYEFFNPASFTHVEMTIDARGLRSGPRSVSPVPAGRRLTVVGDSFVFSEGLSEGELFTDVLQRLVGPGCEVVNAGVPGYGTGQQTLFVERLRSQGFSLGGTVVLVFFTNDLSDNAGLAYESLERDPRKPVFEVRGGELVQTPVAPWPEIPVNAIAAELARRSLLLAFVRNRVEILAASNPWIVTLLARAQARVPIPRPPGVILAWYAAGWEERWARTRGVLEHFASVVQSDGTRLLVAFMPSPFQAEGVFDAVLRSHDEEPLYAAFLEDPDRPQRMLLAFCAEAGLRCVDLTPALRAPRDQPAFFLREGHLGPFGSELVARELHAALGGGC
jgi:hypothetical protein